jgi:hypothetical protein
MLHVLAKKYYGTAIRSMIISLACCSLSVAKDDFYDGRFALDNLDGTNGFTIRNVNGKLIGGAGDVNGDGIDDFLIDMNIVFGSQGDFPAILDISELDADRRLAFTGLKGNAASMGGIGDVNGDFMDDFMVTAFNSGESIHYSYVVLGSQNSVSAAVDLAALDGTNGFTILGDYAITGRTGDINGDGVNDILLGSPFAEIGGMQARGQAHVIFGSAAGFNATIQLDSLDGTNGFTVRGRDSFDYAGRSVSGADVNTDGFADLVVGAPFVRRGDGATVGEVYVVYGAATGFLPVIDAGSLNGNNGFTIEGTILVDEMNRPFPLPISGRLGYSVDSAGDVNGDGIDDLILGAPRPGDGEAISDTGVGAAYVLFGSEAGFPATVDLDSFESDNGILIKGHCGDFLNRCFPRDNLGFDVSGIGDINGDGLSDILLAAPGAALAANDDAEAYVVLGSKNGLPASFHVGSPEMMGLTGSNGFFIDFATSGGDVFVRGIGDVNADGLSDFMIGNPRLSEAYVIFGARQIPVPEPDSLLIAAVAFSGALVVRPGVRREDV